MARHLSHHVVLMPFPRDRYYGKLIVTLYTKLRGKGEGVCPWGGLRGRGLSPLMKWV